MKQHIISLLLAGGILWTATGCGNAPAVKEDTVWSEYVELGQYTGLNVTKVSAEVSEQDIDDNIQSLLLDMAEHNEVDRAAQEGDVVNVDFTGKIDGDVFPESAQTAIDLTIGDAEEWFGLDQSLIGHRAGESFETTLVLPDTYWQEDLIGKEAVYQVRIHGVYEVVIPELTDDFVQQLSEEAKTVAEYRTEIRTEIEASNKLNADNTMANEIWEQVVDNATFLGYPDEELAVYVEQIMSHYQDEADENEMELEEYLQSIHNTSIEEMRKETEEYAKVDVGERMVAYAIAEKEKIFLTEQDYQEKALEYANEYGLMDVAEFETEYGKEEVYELLLWDKVLLWLIEQSVPVDATGAAG